MAKQKQDDTRKPDAGKSRLKGTGPTSLKTASFMFGIYLMTRNVLQPTLNGKSAEQIEAQFKTQAFVKSLQIRFKHCLTEGADLFSCAFMTEKILQERNPTNGIRFFYCLVRGVMEHNGRLRFRNGKLLKKENDQVMEIVWRVCDVFPWIRERIALEQAKGTKHFQAWQREQRILATEEYPQWKKRIERAERIKANLLAELAEFWE